MTTTLPDRPLPSTASYIIATFIIAACAGYFLGQASSIGLFSSSKSTSSRKSKPHPKKSSWPNSYDVTVHPDSSDEELMTRLKGKSVKKRIRDSEDDEDGSESESESEDREEEERDIGQQQGGLNTFDGSKEECKLVLVVRTDLGMGKGKIAAQCSHAALACYKSLLSQPPSSSTNPSASNPLLQRWESSGQAKIALQVPTEHEMDLLYAKAISVGLCAQVIHDAGRTQVQSGSRTVLGVGPGPRSVVDGVTGGLRLL